MIRGLDERKSLTTGRYELDVEYLRDKVYNDHIREASMYCNDSVLLSDDDDHQQRKREQKIRERESK